MDDAAGPLQLCASQDGGCEAAVHAMRSIFQDSETEAVLVVDANNAFKNQKLSLKNTPLGSTDSPIPQAMPFRLIDIFAFPLEQFFLTRDFPIVSSSSSSSSSSFFFFIFFFFLSHRPSALRKRGKGLIFTPNISTGDGGVHRHQAIVSFLVYDTTIKSQGLQLHIAERRHFTTATPFRIRAMWIYTALIARVVTVAQ